MSFWDYITLVQGQGAPLQGFFTRWESPFQFINNNEGASQEDPSLLFSVVSDNMEILHFIQIVAVATLTTLIPQASTLCVTENVE